MSNGPVAVVALHAGRYISVTTSRRGAATGGHVRRISLTPCFIVATSRSRSLASVPTSLHRRRELPTNRRGIDEERFAVGVGVLEEDQFSSSNRAAGPDLTQPGCNMLVAVREHIPDAENVQRCVGINERLRYADRPVEEPIVRPQRVGRDALEQSIYDRHATADATQNWARTAGEGRSPIRTTRTDGRP